MATYRIPKKRELKEVYFGLTKKELEDLKKESPHPSEKKEYGHELLRRRQALNNYKNWKRKVNL